jgi:hypothetical protein
MRQTDNQLSEMKLQRQEMAKQGKLSEVSAKAAETSARASILSVEWANEIAKLQLSAYLAIRIRITAIKPVPKTGMHEVSLSITLKNYGQTPASKIQFRSFCPEVVGKPDAENTSDGCPAPPDGTLDLSPQQEYTIPFLTSVTHAQLEGLQKQKSLVWKVRPVVVFQNVFGEDFDKVQSFRAGGDRPFDVGEVLGGDDAGIREAGKKEPPKSPSEAADEKRAKINAPQVREERSILTPSEQPHRNNP